jgi:hypothetical protein
MEINEKWKKREIEFKSNDERNQVTLMSYWIQNFN